MAPGILIVDDSLTVRMDLAEAFESQGYATTLCASVGAARAALADDLPALVMLDVLLPDGDGVELLTELRADPRTAQLPVVLLSSEAEVRDRIRGLARGADAYVGKPYDAAHIVARATGLLRPSRERSAPLILVIDDSRTYRESMREMLQEAGYEVLLASNGEEGLLRAASARPDAVVVDGIMPGLDGPSVIRRLRLDPGMSDLPCLLLTASEGAATEIEALDAGADAYVRKTEGPKSILARLTAATRAAVASRARPQAESMLGPKRILAVDDSPTYLEVLAERLREEGYDLIKASSGEEALDLLAVEQVDCILLDLVMPGLSGTETCRRVKRTPALRRIPLIMLTAMDEQSAMIAGIDAGADDYLSKAADADVLKARLRAQLRRKQFEDENCRIRDELLRTHAEAEAARRVAEARQDLLEQLSEKNEALSRQTGELQRLNEELRTFAYSVSHDLRQPLRTIDGFGHALQERYGAQLDEQGAHFLDRVRAGAQRMDALIDGLLALCRVSQRQMRWELVRLDTLAQNILAGLQRSQPERQVEVHVAPDLAADGDPRLLESLLENLLGNAWKFTAKRPTARVEVGAEQRECERVFFVRDDGAGFDMAYAGRLFGPFQRLHASREYEGTGIGLATVQRIVHRHGGRIWAEAAPGEGATFYFTLGTPLEHISSSS